MFIIYWILVLYAGLCIFAYFGSDKMIYPKPEFIGEVSSRIVKLERFNGEMISAIYLDNPRAKFVLLYSHGNADDLSSVEPLLKEYHTRGYAIMAYDYPGYGTSQGSPSEEGCYEAIDLVCEYLIKKKGRPSSEIVLYGRSLGGGPSIDLASRRKFAGLILEGTFTSTFRVMTKWRILPFDRFSNIDKIAEIESPILVIHGKQDEIVPFKHGVKLLTKAKSKKDFLWLETASHNNVLEVGGVEYWNKLDGFIKNLSG